MSGDGRAVSNAICEREGHDWMPTSLAFEGAWCSPCRHCTAEIRCTPGQEPEIIEDSWDVSVHGIKLDIEDDPFGGVAKVVCRELESSYLIKSIVLNAGDVVFDIGAHVGVVSAYLAKRWPGIRIYALEPVPANYQRLVRNLRANGCEGVGAINAGLSGNGRFLSLQGNPSLNSGGYSAFVQGSNGNGPRIRVRTVTLEWLFAQFNIARCKLLKIDCEGAEYEVLAAKPELLGRVDYLVGEFHVSPTLSERGRTPKMLLDLAHQYIPPERVHVTTSRMAG